MTILAASIKGFQVWAVLVLLQVQPLYTVALLLICRYLLPQPFTVSGGFADS